MKINKYSMFVIVILCCGFLSAQGLVVPTSSGSGINITNNYYLTNLTGNLTNISQMADVDYTGVDDNDVLKWDDAIKQWIDSSLNSILSFGDDWFSFTDVNEISFNEVKLNATIDMRSSTGGNSSFNQTLTDSLYSPIGTGGNSSWNQTYANDLYVNVNGDTMTGDLNMNNNNVTDLNCVTYDNGAKICNNNSAIMYVGGI